MDMRKASPPQRFVEAIRVIVLFLTAASGLKQGKGGQVVRRFGVENNGVVRETIRKIMYQAKKEYGGWCASVSLRVLGDVFNVFVDEMTLNSGIGIRIPGRTGSRGGKACGPDMDGTDANDFRFDETDADGMALTAHAGVGQFLAVVARQRGMSPEETFSLCGKWQGCFAGWRPDEESGQEGDLDGAGFWPGEPGETSDVKDGTDGMKASQGETFLAVLMLAYAFIDGRRELLGLDFMVAKPRKYYDNIYEDRESMFQHSPYALEEELTRAVAKGDGRKALKALRAITAQGEKAVLAKDSLRSAKNSMIGSIAFLARAAIQAGVGADDAFSLSDALTQKIEDMTSKNAVLAFEENILLQFVELVKKRLEQTYSAPVMRAIHYIENHLDKKISLEKTAEYVGVHAVYLSARFKKETGTSFSNYIVMRKIQESSYFVRHTDYAISQIAYLYGFSSQSYYITSFKKVMGMRPMEYRQRFVTE